MQKPPRVVEVGLRREKNDSNVILLPRRPCGLQLPPCDRDQSYLLPPSLEDWLPEDHLAWFLLDAVKEMELRPFYAKHREDGWGAPAFEPTMMVTLLLYAYCIGERSSRRIERRCQEDIAFRVIAANSAPDHSTIARFRRDNEQALAACFTQVLALCAAAGLVRVGVVAVDGTKLEANASLYANRGPEAIEREVQGMLAEAAATDLREDELLGADNRGDELPEGLRSREGRLSRLKECKARLEAEDVKARYETELARRAAIEKQTGRRPVGRPPKPKKSTKIANRLQTRRSLHPDMRRSITACLRLDRRFIPQL